MEGKEEQAADRAQTGERGQGHHRPPEEGAGQASSRCPPGRYRGRQVREAKGKGRRGTHEVKGGRRRAANGTSSSRTYVRTSSHGTSRNKVTKGLAGHKESNPSKYLDETDVGEGNLDDEGWGREVPG